MIKKSIIALLSSLIALSAAACNKSVSESFTGVIEYEFREGKTFVFMFMLVAGYDKVLLEEVDTGKEFYKNGDVVKLSFDKKVELRFYSDYVYLNTYPTDSVVLGSGVIITAGETDVFVTIPLGKAKGEGDALTVIDGGRTILTLKAEKKDEKTLTVTVPRSSFNAFFFNYDKEFILARSAD